MSDLQELRRTTGRNRFLLEINARSGELGACQSTLRQLKAHTYVRNENVWYHSWSKKSRPRF